MRYVLSYDITEDKPRTKVAKLMEGVLTRVQYSVFEGDVPEPRLTEAVQKAIGLIDPETDSIRIYHLGKNWEQKVEHHGKNDDYNIDAPLIL